MGAWLNGTLTPAALIDAADRGFTLGDGLFETIRAVGGRACHLDRHLARLHHGARLLQIPVPYGDAAIGDAITALLHQEGLNDATVRVTLSRGPAPRGLLPPSDPRPTLLITASPPAPAASPARAIIARSTCRNERSPLCGVKSLNYLDNIIARQEAAARGGDEAILLNTQGRVADTSIANLILELDGKLVTPPLSDGALPGIMRGLLIDRAGVAECSIAPEDLYRANSACLSSSLALRPLASVDGRVIGDGGKAATACCAKAIA